MNFGQEEVNWLDDVENWESLERTEPIQVGEESERE